MSSIKTRLTVGLVAATLLIAAAAAAVLLVLVRQRLIQDFDNALEAKTRAMAGMVRREPSGKIEMDFADEVQREFLPGKAPEYFEVWDARGNVVERSPSLGTRDLPITTRGPLALPDGRSGRITSLSFVPEAADEDDEKNPPVGGGATLALAKDSHQLSETLAIIGWGLSAAAIVMTAGGTLAVWILVRRGLRPLEHLAEQAHAINAATLSNRFGTSVPIELTPIVARLNELLGRLEEAFSRERRFTAAAAHELRTPIAELKTITEVALRWPGDSAAAQRTMQDVLATIDHMESLAAALLRLSRCESGQESPARESVDLLALLNRAWDGCRQISAQRHIALRIEDASDGLVIADPAMTEAAVRNILENAAEYSPPGSEIVCKIRSGRLTVTNPQQALLAEDLSRVFEPFWRMDKARAGGIHAGLGLTLVRAYATAMNASVTAELTPAGKFRLELAFPSSSGHF